MLSPYSWGYLAAFPKGVLSGSCSMSFGSLLAPTMSSMIPMSKPSFLSYGVALLHASHGVGMEAACCRG